MVDVGDVLRGHEVVTAEQWKGRSPRRWFRGAVAGLLAVVTGAGGAVFHSTPAQADPLLFVSINVPISVTAVFGGSGIDRAELEAAKRQIIIAINEATNEIQDHLERLEIATLTACVNATIIDLDASGDFPIDPRIDFAQEATRCAIRIHEQMKVVQNLQHVNSLGYLSLVAFPAAMAARAQAGLPNDEFVVSYIQALELTIERQRPACYYERPQDRPDYLRYYCYALDGTYAQYQQRADRGPIPEEMQEAVRAYATRNISRAAAVAVLPEMQRLLPKLRRGFVFGSVLSGQVSEWNTQGPHFWNQIGNPGNARSVTALATALDIRDNTRHIVAVVDGEVRHRLRRQDGGLTSWSDPGSLGHPGTATAVTAAANQQGETHVVAVIDGQIQHRLRFANGPWTPWALLGNPGTATAVAGTVDPSGGLHLVAVLDGQTHHRTRNADGSWTPWGSIGHAGNATAVASLFDPQGIVQVAAIVDGKFYHRGRYPAGWWSDWSSPGANPSFATAVAGAIDPDGNAQFAIVDDDRVYQRTRFPDSWTPAWNPVEFFPFDSFGTTAVAAS
jgi:hypothetical protein